MMIKLSRNVNMIRERNPSTKFIFPPFRPPMVIPAERGLPYAAWGIGIAENSKHKAEAWKLVSYLMSPEVNRKLVTLAHAFPGNVNAKPAYITSDAMYAKAFQIFKSGYLANEFMGLPVAEQLMREFDEQIQLMLDGKQTAEQATAKAQAEWVKSF